MSRRSRRVDRWAALSAVGSMLLIAGLALVSSLAPALFFWAALAAAFSVGLLFLRTAYASGQARGAFRRVFRRVKEDARRARANVRQAARPPIVEPVAVVSDPRA